MYILFYLVEFFVFIISYVCEPHQRCQIVKALFLIRCTAKATLNIVILIRMSKAKMPYTGAGIVISRYTMPFSNPND